MEPVFPMLIKTTLSFLLLVALLAMAYPATAAPTYAERLGWEPGAKVVIFHVDDVGMSHSSNAGAIKAMEQGAATSCSVMMPCGWVSEYARYLKEHPDTDAGLHMTLTAEWKNYRWGPLAGKNQVPGLVDEEGCLWHNVAQVVAHASPDEVELEMRAQIDRALAMGLKPTHLDTHMGTVYATPEFMERYIKLGVEYQIPVMIPAGHAQFIAEEERASLDQIRVIGEHVWAAGLPVLDDLFTGGYGWKDRDQLERYIQVLKNMKPGLLQIIIHASDPSDIFPLISGSGPTRKADMEAMMAPRLRDTIRSEGIILTTWRELKARRDKAGK